MVAGTPNESEKSTTVSTDADQPSPASGSAISLVVRESSESAATETGNSKPKVKRNRIILSCQPCHRRKQQCDRGHPCQRCVGRGAAHLCKYEQPRELGKRKQTEGGFTVDITERVDNLEGLVNNTLSSLEPSALAGLDALIQLMHNAITAPTSTSEASDPGRSTDAVQAAVVALGQLAQHQNSAEPISTAALPPFSPIAEFLQSIRSSPLGGSAPGTLADFSAHFPDHKTTQFLLAHFFESSSVQWIWPIVHRPCFENYYRTFSSAHLPPSIEFTALLAVTCATALQFLPETAQDAITFADYPQGRHAMKQRLYEFARSVLVSSAHPPISSIERVQALALFALYQWNEGNAGECYYIATVAIRMAQTLAMNRDGEATWHMRPEDAEVRRRIWWTLFIFDRFHCIEYQRPYMIFEQHTDVALPMNLDQADIRDVGELVPRPLDEPTDSLFHVLQSRFAQLAGRLWDQCFSITLPTYRKVMEMEDELRKFELELPASFRYQSTQAALARPYLRFQSQILTLEVYHVRADLLRSFLFIRPSKPGAQVTEQDSKLYTFHVHARALCLLFCKRILSLLQLFQSQVPRAHLRWTSLVLHAYESALMLAVAIIMDPENPENEELEEWITLARSLLEELDTYNLLAPNAIEHIDVIQKRTSFVLSLTATQRTSSSCRTSANPFLMDPTLQRIERATRVLSQPQPSLGDLLGHDLARDPFWSTLRPGVFAGHFPGMESLSGPINPQNLEHFLDSCLSMQSRLPPIFAF